MRRHFRILALASPVVLSLLVFAAPVAAEPTTAVGYPNSAQTTRFNGYAFDTCEAPSLAAMRAWRASDFRGVGVYIGGENRTCGQANLTADWVGETAALGWRLVPIYMGRQAPCTTRPNSVKITPDAATAQGVAAATDAIGRATALGMRPGSGIYADMEPYDVNNTTCRTAVLRYLSSWTKELHLRGYVSGVYANLSSGAQNLSAAYTSTSYARPDALWIARWDGNPSLTGWTGVSNSKWANHQRAKQYRGDHNETHGGVTINIDSNRFDGPVASVTFGYQVTSDTSLDARSGPSGSSAVVGSHSPGAALTVLCQAAGTKVGTTTVWDKLADGTYVTDYHVSTPSNTGYSSPLPKCRYPYQVRSADGLKERTGPGTSYRTVRTLPNGALAWIMCQRAGSKVGTTTVWDRLDDGYYVSDYYVATPSNTGYSGPAPRC